jgi:hypothetical protein
MTIAVFTKNPNQSRRMGMDGHKTTHARSELIWRFLCGALSDRIVSGNKMDRELRPTRYPVLYRYRCAMQFDYALHD